MPPVGGLVAPIVRVTSFASLRLVGSYALIQADQGGSFRWPLPKSGNMTVPFKYPKSERLIAYREEVAWLTIRRLWRGKWRIVTSFIVAVTIASAVVVVVRPRYTAEAIIQFDFGHEVNNQDASVKIQPIAVLEASVLVESAARLIRLRATASGVVDRLKLYDDPSFLHEPILLRLISSIRSAVGLDQSTLSPSNEQLAISALMRRVVVRSEPRSYLISISVTAEDPDQAAKLANAVAMEYLRSQLTSRLNEARSTTEREVAQMSFIYGDHHPNYLRAEAALSRIKGDQAALAEGQDLADDFGPPLGQSLIPAEAASIPSVPNINLTLAIGAIVGLIIGAWWALRQSPANR
jgi:uncharacterized protein involved in exopolysaccharide biosynthesis